MKANRKIFFIIFTILISLILIEISLRGVVWIKDTLQNDGVQKGRRFYLGKVVGSEKAQTICDSELAVKSQLHPYLSYNPLPDQYFPTVTINQDSYRGKPVTKKKPPNTVRIILLGGSVAFGTGASSDSTTISAYMENLLNTDTKTKYEVLNFGYKGYVTRQELILVIIKALKYEPDYIISLDGANNIAFVYYDNRYGYPLNFAQVRYKWSPRPFYKNLMLKVAIDKVINIMFFANSSKNMQVSLEDNNQEMAHDYEVLSVLCNSYQIKCYIALQPQLGILSSKTMTTSEKILLEHEKRILRLDRDTEGYESLRNLIAQKYNEHFIDLTKVFNPYNDLIFVDNVHFWDKGNLIVAWELIKNMGFSTKERKQKFKEMITALPAVYE